MPNLQGQHIPPLHIFRQVKQNDSNLRHLYVPLLGFSCALGSLVEVGSGLEQPTEALRSPPF